MSQWYRKDLGNGMVAFQPTREMQTSFMAVFLLEKPGSGRAMFSRYDLASDNIEVYFTPETADIAKSFGARPCEKPTLNDYQMGLLCGDGNDLSIHFPEQRLNQR